MLTGLETSLRRSLGGDIRVDVMESPTGEKVLVLTWQSEVLGYRGLKIYSEYSLEEVRSMPLLVIAGDFISVVRKEAMKSGFPEEIVTLSKLSQLGM